LPSSFCPSCGTPRVGALRFCPSCKFDFDEIDRTTGAVAAPQQTPESGSSATPQSYSEKYAGTPWAVAPLPTATVEPGEPHSPRGRSAIFGLAGIAVVAGLVVVLAAGGLGKSPAAPAATTSTVSPATEQPTASPNTDPMDAAASRFRTIENAYLTAYKTLHDTLPTTGVFASYAQARSYYRTEVKNLERFGSNVREMTFPASVMPDVNVLLERISELAGLMTKLAATKDETAGWKVNEKIMTARTAMHAARLVVGEDLGLAEAPTPTPKPTSNPVAGKTPFIDYLLRHGERAGPEILGIVEAILLDAQYVDDAGFRSDNKRLYSRLSTEIKWLKAHQPQPCYTRLWKVQLAGYEDLLKSASYGKAGNWPAATKYMRLSSAHDAEINDNGMIDEATDRCLANAAKPG